MGWTFESILIPSSSPSPPFPGQLEKPPPCLEGVSRTPPHDLIAGSWRAGMASGFVAPECTPGMGAAENSAVWHDLTGGGWGGSGAERGLSTISSYRGGLHLWKPGPPGPASGPRGGPNEHENKRQLELLMKPKPADSSEAQPPRGFVMRPGQRPGKDRSGLSQKGR